MKLHLMIGAVALAMVAAEALAQCDADTRVINLNTVLSGNTVCAERGTDDKWQEQHVAGGALFDYKRGPGDRIDPIKEVGTWSIGPADDEVTYSYTNGPSLTFTVHEEGGRYNFCADSVASITGARIVSGITSCGFQ